MDVEFWNAGRVGHFLRQADLYTPQRIPRLSKPDTVDFQSLAPSSGSDARSLLVNQRTSEPGYRPPDQQLRNRWSSRRRDEKANQANWTFSKHEIAKTFDTLLSHQPLAPPGVAQALLSFAAGCSLDELWSHLHDPKLEKRMASRFRRSRSSLCPEPTWLNDATEKENFDYLRLMCDVGFDQVVLSNAFSVALSNQCMEAMEILLSYGATASVQTNQIRDHLKQGNGVELARLLIAAPDSMSTEAWRNCMEAQLDGPSTILLLCLAHRPEVVNAKLLLESVRAQSFEAFAITLAYASSNTNFSSEQESTCKSACSVQSDEMRLKFLTAMADAGLLKDDPILREELMKDVKLRHFPLVRLLAKAKVSLNIEPTNAFHHIVSEMDLELMDIIKHGKFFSSISPALKVVPKNASESDSLQLLSMLMPLGLAGEPLHSYLVRAVQNKHDQLIEVLIKCGASIEFEQCLALRTAVEQSDFGILDILLRGQCSRGNMSAVLPIAMALKSRAARARAMTALMRKGVSPPDLGSHLRTLVAEDGEVDQELILLLLQHKAPVDPTDNSWLATNPVLTAAGKGHVAVLRMLCNASPRIETLSKAVPVAFGTLEKFGYTIAFDEIQMLLEDGATGSPVNETLVNAVSQDSRLDIVRLLLKHGADANYQNGACYRIAIEMHNIELIETLCASSQPTRESLESVLMTATDPQHFVLQSLDTFLKSAPDSAVVLNSSWRPKRFKNNPNMNAIIPCFLQHGLDINLNNGSVLSYGVEIADITLLRTLLAAKPNTHTLSAGFVATNTIRARPEQLLIMEMLLKQAESTEIGQSSMLLHETRIALAGDTLGLMLLLNHNAMVNFDGGSALRAAAIVGSLEILDFLFSFNPSPSSLGQACLAVASSALERNQKERVFRSIFHANDGALVSEMGNLLADSIASQPESTDLPALLLEHGAKVNLETMQSAVPKVSRELFVLLANSIQSHIMVVEVFRYASKATISLARRQWMYEWLLQKDIPSDEVSNALIEYLESRETYDLDILKLLLHHGASVRHDNGKPFTLSLRVNSLNATKLLIQYIKDDSTAELAFNIARKASLESVHMRREVYRCILQWRISPSPVYRALVESLERGHSDTLLVRLLVENGADPNEDNARCFVLAAKEDNEAEFRALCKHANLSVLALALLSSFSNEQQVVWWFSVCLEEQPLGITIDSSELLFKCPEAFPQGVKFLKILLDNGLPTSVMSVHSICPGWPPELCTVLIWALFSKAEIGNNTILMLLAYSVSKLQWDSNYLSFATSVTGVSAAFGCLLNIKRAPVLKLILELDRDGSMSYEIPMSSFTYLGAYPNNSKVESGNALQDRISLRYAALYLGNLEAFRLLNQGERPNDGMLQLSSLLALPRLVEWLLETHDPNLKLDEYDNMVPLAIVCKAEPQSWSKIANEESDFRTRQKETMKILAPKTSMNWRYLGKTVLHIALENGTETTKAMLEALNTRLDPDRYQTFCYTDKQGEEFPPHRYVSEILNRSDAEKEDLYECLETGGFNPWFSQLNDSTSDVFTLFSRHSLPPTYFSAVGASTEGSL